MFKRLFPVSVQIIFNQIRFRLHSFKRRLNKIIIPVWTSQYFHFLLTFFLVLFSKTTVVASCKRIGPLTVSCEGFDKTFPFCKTFSKPIFCFRYATDRVFIIKSCLRSFEKLFHFPGYSFRGTSEGQQVFREPLRERRSVIVSSSCRISPQSSISSRLSIAASCRLSIRAGAELERAKVRLKCGMEGRRDSDEEQATGVDSYRLMRFRDGGASSVSAVEMSWSLFRFVILVGVEYLDIKKKCEFDNLFGCIVYNI